MKIRCHTNLDLFNEQWPEDLPILPRVGDHIESATEWTLGGMKCKLQLAVVRVTWEHSRDIYHYQNNWIPRIELHLPPHRFENLIEFYAWYGEITGKGKSFFI